jgi:SagB-type dehydrogenase family enzyme
VRNYARGSSVRLGLPELSVLEHCPTWTAIGEIKSHCDGADRAIDDAIQRLLDAGILESTEQPQDPRDRTLDQWGGWNPTAAAFHLETRDVPFATMEARRRASTAWLPVSTPPPRREETAELLLPAYPRQGELPDVLLRRRTWRRFGAGPLTLRQLSTLLGLTWGTQRWVEAGRGFEFPIKTSPSGGSCHSLDVHIVAMRVRGLAPGIYRYLSDAHGLVRVRDGWPADEISERVGHQTWVADAGAMFLVSSRFEHVQWKYQSPRAYRVVLLETGHFGQTFCLTATWMGLAPFCTAAFADSILDRDLGFDGISESVLYVLGAGSRPSGSALRDTLNGKTLASRPSRHLRRGSRPSTTASGRRG